ncbi:hypothetical protein ACFYWX_32760 [Streptomyces sp. NPDC002888]|uniref:LppU/SCO3897 family protein n=1 Tax=Streptomyces sp. NPDC002888 TaxID=3364668 RepID=UPI0036A89285
MSTPPPQGNPFAQGQQPQGQAPYPPQGGYPTQPVQPGYPQGAAPYAPVPPEQPRRKVSFKLIKNVVIVIAVAGVAIGGYISSRDDANTAAVGDCMHRGSTDDNNPDLEVVDCGSSKAAYKVAQKKDDGSGCDRSKYSEYTETGGDSDFTLCLEDYSAK